MHIRGRTYRFARRIGGVAVLVAGLVAAAQAEPTPRGVVELFTSQGCPKCPPADRLIADLAHEPGTIALSFPVGLWDYIGWKDTLASPAFSDRQHAYALARGDKLIFTPQAIVDGVDVEPGADRTAISKDVHLLAERQKVLDVPLSLSESSGSLHVALGASPEGRRPAEPVGVYILRVAREKTVEIGRGENSGRSVTYTNVVRAMNKVGVWDGMPARFDVLELKGDGEGFVVLLQTGTPDKPGPILAAAKTADL